jgi:transposase
VDESGYDKRIGFRRTGWAALCVTPTQVERFQREHRYQILPVYTQDGIILANIFRGSTDSTVFEDFMKQLLLLCGKCPEPKSVLVMDTASFHYTKRIEQMCYDAGVKPVYLPPYSPNFNPIEEFFAELKLSSNRTGTFITGVCSKGFDMFLESCMN